MKIVIKAENRAYPDNIGDYLWESLKPAAAQLDVELIRLPCEEFYSTVEPPAPKRTDINRPWDIPSAFSRSIRLEIDWINKQDADLFIFFSNWVHGRYSRKIAPQYKAIKCPVMFWSREDPNHFKHFLSDARYADIIGTCCSDCVPKYEAEPNRKEQKVISLPMAVAPEIFYPPKCGCCCGTGRYRWIGFDITDGNLGDPDKQEWIECEACKGTGNKPYSDREWDIVFLGNRYTSRKIRNDAEQAVVIAAAKWAIANGKKMGVWGHDGAPYGWHKVPEIYKTGIYQGRVDRLQAADVYRNAKVALSVSSNDYSPTMAPNRVVQIAACGTILIAYKSPATEWQTDFNAPICNTASATEYRLNGAFGEEGLMKGMSYYAYRANKARAHVLAHHTFKHRLETILEAMK